LHVINQQQPSDKQHITSNIECSIIFCFSVRIDIADSIADGNADSSAIDDTDAYTDANNT
jgi:hypothetical protein